MEAFLFTFGCDSNRSDSIREDGSIVEIGDGLDLVADARVPKMPLPKVTQQEIGVQFGNCARHKTAEQFSNLGERQL